METRAAWPCETLLDVCDRACTVTFLIGATVRGPLPRELLERALRVSEQRHPLLRSRVLRSNGIVTGFEEGAGAPIPIHELDAPRHALSSVHEELLKHRAWPDDGPRAELSLIRHDPDHTSLAISFHHIVSDGNSGFVLLRELLQFVSDQQPLRERVPSPGQNALFPRSFGGFLHVLRWLAMVLRMLLAKRPFRVRMAPPVPPEQRRPYVHHVTLSPADAWALQQRGREVGATMHGVLSAALALAIASEERRPLRQRIGHLVDMRKQRAASGGEDPTLDQAIGMYAGNVVTDHDVSPDRALGSLAAEISAQTHQRLERGEALLSAPMAWLVQRAAKMELATFRKTAEENAHLSTFALTNLGRVDAIVPTGDVLAVEEAVVLVGGSVFNTLVASAYSFAGSTHLRLVSVAPMASREYGARVAAHTQALLASYARAHHEASEQRQGALLQASERIDHA